MLTFGKSAKAALAVGALSLAGSALADTIQIDSFTYTGTHSTYSSTINKSDNPTAHMTTPGGELSGLLNGNSFQTFCADIFQAFAGWGPSNANSSYSLVAGSTAFGASKSTDVNKLFTNWYGSANNEANSTAFQLALWEIVYESGSSYDLGTGTFTASGGTATAGIYNTANNWLANLGSLGSVYKQVDVYQSGSFQDFTTVSTVPEPEAYALALASLGVLIGARRINRRGKKTSA